MDFKIDHPCPQCGGPVTLDESDRILACPYCRVRLQMTSRGPFRYCLPSKRESKGLVYLPYWRFKGTIYTAVPHKVDPHLLDATLLANDFDFAPKSMGLRPQALHLTFATAMVKGQFVRPTTPFPAALETIEKQVQGIRAIPNDEDLLDKAYIGETTSIIYAPYIVKGGTLIDGILDKPAGKLPPGGLDIIRKSLIPRMEWTPKFLAALCPYCGWNLKGERGSSVFVCKNCSSGWNPQDESFKKIAVGTLETKNTEEQVYLPFWCIIPDIDGLRLATRADLIRVANVPKAIQKEWETEPFAFWIPAFKVHPHLFLRLSRQITTAPFDGEYSLEAPQSTTHPVNLPLAEAVQSLKMVLATFGKPKRAVFQKLPDIEIKPKMATLIYAPFHEQGSELVQEELGFGISKQALYHGKDM